MKKFIKLLFVAFSLSLIFPSCGPSEKEIRERIEKERQDSIRVANERTEALRLEEQRKREEEQRKWEASQTGKGWNYVRQRLKSPSTASLVAYVEPDNENCRAIARKVGLSGLSVASYCVDAQNSFGATIRSNFFVFFKNGTPVYIAEEDEMVDDPDILRMALELNGY